MSCAAPRLARVLKHAAATQDPLVFSQKVSSPHDFVAVRWLHQPAIFSGMFNMLAQGLFVVVFNFKLLAMHSPELLIRFGFLEFITPSLGTYSPLARTSIGLATGKTQVASTGRL